MSKTEIMQKFQTYNGEIIIHTYKLEDYVNISYIYKHNIPLDAKITRLLDESYLDEQETENMIKTAINYAYKHMPTLPIFKFEDNSHICCDEINPPYRPLNLAFFYIAYHDKTWYEARFNAKMIDDEKYKTYRNSLCFLTDPAKKPPFIEFLQIIAVSFNGSTKIIPYLEMYYNKARTYRDFFNNIPETEHYEILLCWLNTFMNHYIGHTFSDKGWFIDVNNMDCDDSLSLDKKYRIFSYRNITCF